MNAVTEHYKTSTPYNQWQTLEEVCIDSAGEEEFDRSEANEHVGSRRPPPRARTVPSVSHYTDAFQSVHAPLKCTIVTDINRCLFQLLRRPVLS